MIDLWEEKIYEMCVIDKKMVKIGEMEADLAARIARREGLEADNEDLRSQIAVLEAKLADRNRGNDNLLKKYNTITEDWTGAVKEHNSLTNTVTQAHKNSQTLKKALESGFAELANLVNEDDTPEGCTPIEPSAISLLGQLGK